MLNFIIGLFIGSILGMFVMGLMAMSKHSDLEMEILMLKEKLEGK